MADSQPPEGLQPKISDDEQSRHPQAFQLLYDAYRHMDCPGAVDPVDPDDCASVAEESVRVLMQAGLLLPPEGEVKEQWAVRWHLVGGGVDEQDCYRNARETAEQRARRLAARPPMGVERGEALMRRIYTDPWSPVFSDNTEGQPQ